MKYQDWSTEIAWTEIQMHETLGERMRLLASSSNFEESNAMPDFVPQFINDLGIAVAARKMLHNLTMDQPEETMVAKQGMLCVETMIKLFYFSRLVYRVGVSERYDTYLLCVERSLVS